MGPKFIRTPCYKQLGESNEGKIKENSKFQNKCTSAMNGHRKEKFQVTS